MACAKMGLLYIAMNPLFNSQQISNLSLLSNPSLIISEPPYLPNLQSINPSIPQLVLSEEFDPNNWIAQEHTPSHLYQPSSSQITNLDPFQVVFTSGTTGAPKGCIYSHNTIYCGAQTVHSNYIGKTAPNKDATLFKE